MDPLSRWTALVSDFNIREFRPLTILGSMLIQYIYITICVGLTILREIEND